VAGAAAGADDRPATVRVTPVGPHADHFATQLLAMYASWGEHAGRQVSKLADDAIEIEGLASYELLRGEHGLHRYAADNTRSLLARVSVTQSGDEEEPDDGAMIVRHYHRGQREFVRDPRTGVRVSDLDHVLIAGVIDAFLLEVARGRSADHA
jgi:hypothetical protein